MEYTQTNTSLEDEAAFEKLFKTHFRELHAYAYSLLKDWDLAEDTVQQVFLKLLEKNEWMLLQTAVRSYLYKAVYHDSLNYIRRQKVQLKYQNLTVHSMKNHTDDAAGKLKMSELEEHLSSALDKLPEKCRAIFHLSRFEELKYQEIATQLDISIKTVESQMGKALRILRAEMKDFLPLISIVLFKIFR